jgi:hypothetical protein
MKCQTGNTRKYFSKNMKFQEILENIVGNTYEYQEIPGKIMKYYEILGDTTKYQEIL